MMDYPTPEAVEAADLAQLADWYENLPEPGTLFSVMANPMCANAARRHEEVRILSRIGERLDALGGLDCLGDVTDELKAGA